MRRGATPPRRARRRGSRAGGLPLLCDRCEAAAGGGGRERRRFGGKREAAAALAVSVSLLEVYPSAAGVKLRLLAVFLRHRQRRGRLRLFGRGEEVAGFAGRRRNFGVR